MAAWPHFEQTRRLEESPGKANSNRRKKSLVGANLRGFLFAAVDEPQGSGIQALIRGEGFDQRVGVGDSLLSNHVRCLPLTIASTLRRLAWRD